MQIHVLGDSIVTAYGSDENNFIGGWGDHLNSFFKNEVPVFVYAEGGRSSRRAGLLIMEYFQRINFHMAWDRHMTGFAPEIMF